MAPPAAAQPPSADKASADKAFCSDVAKCVRRGVRSRDPAVLMASLEVARALRGVEVTLRNPVYLSDAICDGDADADSVECMIPRVHVSWKEPPRAAAAAAAAADGSAAAVSREADFAVLVWGGKLRLLVPRAFSWECRVCRVAPP